VTAPLIVTGDSVVTIVAYFSLVACDRFVFLTYDWRLEYPAALDLFEWLVLLTIIVLVLVDPILSLHMKQQAPSNTIWSRGRCLS
jgi:hypothetical protein